MRSKYASSGTERLIRADEAHQAERLRRMKRLPVLLLLLMAALYLFTRAHGDGWSGWLNAFAEAAMVGALADWFAVVALFRHPLGIPVPHTAIIPRRKDDIGDNMARFVADHFLEPAVVQARLESADPARHIAVWLQGPTGQERVVAAAVRFLSWAAGAWHEQSVRGFLRRLSRHQLERIDLAPLLGQTLDWLVQDGRHQELLTQALRSAVIVLHDHRETIRGNVQRESPWWLPGFVDDRIVQRMLDRIETLLLQMSLDDDHPVRRDFDQALARWIEELRHSPAMHRSAERLRRAALDNERVQDYLYGLWADLVAGIETDLQQSDSALRAQLGDLVRDFSEEFARDGDLREVVNGWLVDSAVLIVESNRRAIASVISDTVRRWDGPQTARRVEFAIGADLQYIRINGTLVGGLAGMLIHAVGRWLY
jgi:uncharacterized membrane-anchored protein YjiN (DUF445 family)